jgi:hypothetical protein
MLPRHVVAEHQVESIDNLKQAALIGIDTLHTLTVLSMQSFRAHLIAPFSWTRAWVDGRSDFEIESKRPAEIIHDSLHILTGRYAELVRVIEAQFQLSHNAAHSTLTELRKWTPRGTEQAMSAIDLAVEAAERSTEVVADAGIAMAQAVDGESAQIESSQRTARRRKEASD